MTAPIDWDDLRTQAIDACGRAYAPYSQLSGRGGRSGGRWSGADRVQRRERVVRPGPVRGVRARVRPPRHRGWAPHCGRVRRRKGTAAGAVRALSPAAARARRADAPVQPATARRAPARRASDRTTCATSDGRHRPDPRPSATAAASPTSRSTGSSAPTPTGTSSTSRPPHSSWPSCSGALTPTSCPGGPLR